MRHYLRLSVKIGHSGMMSYLLDSSQQHRHVLDSGSIAQNFLIVPGTSGTNTPIQDEGPVQRRRWLDIYELMS
jgi:hypothetical protein